MRSTVLIFTKQVAVPSVQANHSSSVTLLSMTRWTFSAEGRSMLRTVVAPTLTPVSYIRRSAGAKDTLGIPRVLQKSFVTKGLSSVVT